VVNISKAYIKTLFRQIQKSFGRFAAIFGIVALGVGFLAGLTATTPVMHFSVDAYYDQNYMADVFIKATMGITEDDVEAISSMNEVERVMPAYVTDVLMENDLDKRLTVRIYGLSFHKMQFEDEEVVNRLQLIDGRMPTSQNECLAELGGGCLSGTKLGTTLKISPDNQDFENIEDIYRTTEFTVVGIVTNPFYFSWEREPSPIGNGRLDAVLYVDESCYALDVYTDVYLTIADTLPLTAFTEEYESKVETIVEKIEALGYTRSEIRYADVLREAREEIDKAKAEYTDAKHEAEAELASAWRELEDGKAELADAWQEIQDGKKELAEAKEILIKETLDAQKQINDGRNELAEALADLEKAEHELEKAKEQLAKGEKEYEEGYDEYRRGRRRLSSAQAVFDEGEREYLSRVSQLEAVNDEIKREEKNLEKAAAKLSDARAEYEEGLRVLSQQQDQFDGLMAQLLDVLSVLGLDYESAEEILQALEKDTTGELTTAVNTVLASAELPADAPHSADELLESWNMLNVSRKALDEAEAEIRAGESAYLAGLQQLSYAKTEYEAAKAQLDAAGAEIEKNRSKLEDGWEELAHGRAELRNARKELDQAHSEIQEARQKIDEGWEDYRNGLAELADAQATLEEEVAKAKEDIRKAEDDLAQGQLEYEEGLRELGDGEAEYWKAKSDAEEELNDAWSKILDAEKEILDLESPEWYVLDRKSNVSYMSFSANTEKVAAIAKVFPVFFFFVAALVALTTMTRMVEEERTQLGTLKALGYSKSTIMSKYIVYSGLASVLGCIVGLLAGFRLLPSVIWSIFESVYRLPSLDTQFRWDLALISSSMANLCTIGSTIAACYSELNEKPAALMRPRTPKAGQRIFLEYITFVWSRMKFTHKATARNLIRYKKHFFMTVIGVAGCTALLVAGFGLKDSIGDLAYKQFDEITKYDLLIKLNDTENIDHVLAAFLNDSEKVVEYVEVLAQSGHVIGKGQRVATTIYVPRSSSDLIKAVNLRERVSGKKINFDDSSVVLTEKMANNLNLRPGDIFTIENENGESGEFRLSAITENYAGTYAYINRDDYMACFQDQQASNALMVKTLIDPSRQDAAITEILTSDSVSSAEFVAQVKESVERLLSSINLVIVVLIISAGALAVIVLYNLININIEERRKELATLKVLGFHDEEVARYIFREVSILSIIGSFVGLGLGILLHAFIIRTAETPDFMFGREVSTLSLTLSAAITLFFSFVVQIIMSMKLKKIKMVDSLKAIE
jgi:putative ABC transport system permease protein